MYSIDFLVRVWPALSQSININHGTVHLPLSSAPADLPGPPGHEGDRGAGEVGGETGDNVSW